MNQHQIEQATLAEARAEGAAAERERIRSIVDCPEAKGKEAAAFTLALQGSVSLVDAKATLAGSDFARGKAIASAFRK